MEKGIFIRDIKDGTQVDGLFLVKEMSRAETKNGKPYLSLALIDNSGEIPARIWDNADQMQEMCSPGSFVAISGQGQAFRDLLQLKITSLQPVDAGRLDLSLFLPASAHDPDDMLKELLQFIDSIDDRHFKELLKVFFSDKQFTIAFKKAPAAKNMHHAYLGGLLEHTLAVCRLVDAVCPLYTALDRDLLMAGAVLHDAGKIEEFSYDTLPFNYSDRGRLEGHMVLCIQMLQEKIRELHDFPAEKATLLKHLILSHHGRHEFGSPAVPMTLEAFILNLLDDFDAKANFIGRLGSQLEEDDYQWSDYQRTLERFLFVRRPDGTAGLRPARLNSGKTNRQQSGTKSANSEETEGSQLSLFNR